MEISQFLTKLKQHPESIQFNETMDVIDRHYDFTPTSFTNGSQKNEVGQNNGSCKLFAFASLQKLTKEETLHCFGDYYRVDVLQHPEKDDHQNIRNFIQLGWEGVKFQNKPLTLKA